MLKVFRYIYLTFILLGYMIEFPIYSGLTTRRLVIAIAISTLLFRVEDCRKIISLMHFEKIKMSVFLLSLCGFITYLHHINSFTRSAYGHVEYWYYFFNVIYILIFAIYCAVEFKSLKEFAIIWTSIMVLESIVIFYAVIDTSFRLFVYDYFYWGDDRFEKTIEFGSRIMGVGLHAATGSLTMSTSIMLLTYMRIKKIIPDLLYFTFTVIIMSATAFIGRTGLMVEIFIASYYILFHGHSVNKQIGGLISFFIIVAGISYVARSSDTGYGDGLLDWMMELFYSDQREETLRGIYHNGFPPLSFDSIFGTGITTGYNYKGVTYYPDSGYIRLWISIGIVGFFSYYIAMYDMLSAPIIKNLPIDEKRYFLFCIFLSFFVEYKEPFMMKYIFPWFIMTIFLATIKEKNVINQ